MKRKGYTIMELMITIFCVTVVIAICHSLIISAAKSERTIKKLSNNVLGRTNIVTVLEEALDGVQSVNLNGTELVITSSKGDIVINSEDFMSVENVEFTNAGDFIVVYVDGGVTCIPIIYEP